MLASSTRWAPSAEGQLEQLLDAVEVLPVQDAVQRQWEVELSSVARGGELALERPSCPPRCRSLSPPGSGLWIEICTWSSPATLQHRVRPLAREPQRPGGDERRVQAGLARTGAELDEISPRIGSPPVSASCRIRTVP